MNLDTILEEGLAQQASDILVAGGEPARFRIGGKLKRVGEVLDSDFVSRMIYEILTPWQIERLEGERQCDFSLDRAGGYRYRVNVYFRRGGLGAAIRPIPLQMPTPEELGIPVKILQLLDRATGLIMVTGRVGTGKSTMCASFLDHLNSTKECHIVTLEDPIEYVFEPKMAAICQREVRDHATSFDSALRAVLRQTPDVIYVGELRDMDTVSATLSVAETGHLVLANLHTNNASQTISRIIDIFPAPQRPLISVQLANALTAVISQALVPRADGTGLIAAREVMFNNLAISNIIRKNELHQLYSQIDASGQHGMKTLERELAELYVSKFITLEDARFHAADGEQLNRNIDRLREVYNTAPTKR